MTPRDRRLAWAAGAIALVVVAVGIGAAVMSRSEDEPSSVTGTTSTTATPGATAPLTGLPSDTVDTRSALGVKIDEAPGVTTFGGLERADLIYEELVEGGITRCLAVFQSQDAPNVGPVRSLRASDFDLVANLGRPIVAFSGADTLTLKASKLAPLVPYTPDSPGASKVFHRDRGFRAPHNLFLSTTGVRDNATGSGPVQAPFTHAAPTAPPPAGLPAAGVRIHWTGFAEAVFAWDATRHQWLRWANGREQVDRDGTQLGVDSVLVLEMAYGHPPWDRNQPQLDSVGSGAGLLLSSGNATVVDWERPAPSSPFTLTGPDGAPLGLPAGRTWVALPPAGATSTIDTAAVAALRRAGTTG